MHASGPRRPEFGSAGVAPNMFAGGQYSTNLDRNRYGNDDNYLFTGGSSLAAQRDVLLVLQAASIMFLVSCCLLQTLQAWC
jgi:hypothetical protein